MKRSKKTLRTVIIVAGSLALVTGIAFLIYNKKKNKKIRNITPIINDKPININTNRPVTITQNGNTTSNNSTN